MTKQKQGWFILISLLIGILSAFILAEGILSLFQERIVKSSQMDSGLFAYSPQLGWKMTPLWHGRQIHLDYNVSYQIGEDGFRYTPEQKKADWLVLGDSFTFGVGVEDNQTFVYHLNQKMTEGWKNLAVAGYSTDQELLLLQSQDTSKIKGILLVIYLGNDLVDNLLAWPIQANFPKPYFILEHQQLKIQNQPVPMLKKPVSAQQSLAEIVFKPIKPHFYKKLQLYQWSKATGLIHTVFSEQQLTDFYLKGFPLLDALLQKIKQQGSLKIVLLAGSSVFYRPHSKSAQWQKWQAKKIQIIAQKLQIPILDLSTPLSLKKTAYFPNEGHLTAQGHLAVAEQIKDFISSKN